MYLVNRGIILISHVYELAFGLRRLLKEVAADVPITIAAGLENQEIGTSFEYIVEAIAQNEGDELFAFYDLGSAKMNLEMAIEGTEKKIHLHDTAFIESAYTAATLLQFNVQNEEIFQQLEQLKIK